MTATLTKNLAEPKPKLSLSDRECVSEEVRKWVWPRPVTFEEFLDLFMGRDEIVELIDGAVVEKDMVQLDHEQLLLWLIVVMRVYAKRKNLGIVLGSRTATPISAFRGRLPDLMFVRQERADVVQQKAVYGAPDLVIEVLSPGDRRATVVALEADYQQIGVPEIVFIDQKRRRVRVLRKQDGKYETVELTTGSLVFDAVPGLEIELDWLFDEQRPDELELLNSLLG